MLEDTIYQDYVAAVKARDKAKVDFFSFLRGELKNQAISLKKDKLDDAEVLASLKKQQKRLQEAKETVATSGRADIVDGLNAELRFLEGYLPKPLAEDEIVKYIDEAIVKTGAVSIKDMGKVMKEVTAAVGVRADAKTVSSLVKGKLSAL